MESNNCPNCAGSNDPDSEKCSWCGSWFKQIYKIKGTDFNILLADTLHRAIMQHNRFVHNERVKVTYHKQ